MSDMTKESRQEADWNVLTGRWLEVMGLDAEAQVCSPLEALNRASKIRCIAVASPLDLFAAHRFLLTLLYWKADAVGGVQQVRESLLRGEVPRAVLDAIEVEAPSFRLFDDKVPFFQEASQRDAKKNDWKPASSLFAEFASGTNIAHFHHGDDMKMRVCVRCATLGMLRLVPWTQAGGAGLSPSIHGAPPVMAMASGANLAITLGLNLVPLSVGPGVAQWSGHFVPTVKTAAIPYLEAFTWNPRRVNLRSPKTAGVCWGCGQPAIAAVGPIVYLKNEETATRKDRGKTIPFAWQDPSAFYAPDSPQTTRKSSDEKKAVGGSDLRPLTYEESTPASAVTKANPDHQRWLLVVPCTNPANNKTFDHRQVALTGISPGAIRAQIPDEAPDRGPRGVDGWVNPERAAFAGGAAQFVRAAARVLTYPDWVALSTAAYRNMHESPVAFDVLSGLLWSLRKKITGLPLRNVAWLMLKLMATVPPAARIPHRNATFCPLQFLPKRQIDERRQDRSVRSPYPVSFPRGQRLEADLRSTLGRNMRKRFPEHIDWVGLCYGLDQLLD